ncbi:MULTISPECIES: phytanoyl-CoA dioxygenase family protein [unclassified Burkholderia]|uniref:phytanoyl-CoA dioxygenase family protein n=1 Tax=unclassified Burkholderia TaxID=2613784 RepID=UPI0021AB972A|nr:MULTISPECIES: phytanoyl-CoA dioxygenase family protein [unclassified Burkholderia]
MNKKSIDSRESKMVKKNPESREAQVQELRERGFVVAKGFVDETCLHSLLIASQRELVAARYPLEFEADLRYPGAPESKSAPGGGTVRRLLDAYSRDLLYARLATSSDIRNWMEMYFGETPYLSLAHHNCIMTKHPAFGSKTGWHRDSRYWSFERDDLVSVWVALGQESAENGGLWFVPESHRLMLASNQLDDARFFRADLPENDQELRRAVAPELEPGDVVFFHCNTLHSAGRNHSKQVKLSLVYTYRGQSNVAMLGTRSCSKPEVALN